MEAVWDSHGRRDALKTNYANNLTMNNPKRHGGSHSGNVTFHKADFIDPAVKKFTKTMGEYVKPSKSRPEPTYSEVCRNSYSSCSQPPPVSAPAKPCRKGKQQQDPWLISKYEEMKRLEQEEYRPVKPVTKPVYTTSAIPDDDSQDIFAALRTFHDARIREHETKMATDPAYRG